MGAWGEGHFENDDALDWVWSLEGDDDGAAIRAVLDPVAAAARRADVEAPEASVALAAAAVVAKATGASQETLPDEAEAWVSAHGSLVGAELVALALSAVRRVRDNSELRELWDEAGADEWLAHVDRLAAQLGGDDEPPRRTRWWRR